MGNEKADMEFLLPSWAHVQCIFNTPHFVVFLCKCVKALEYVWFFFLKKKILLCTKLLAALVGGRGELGGGCDK